ncbi:MAG: HlyC/CorC family transporter [Clostridia bacterium]|nr:HlyC/CorC family transporter [Clostridia bacterium]MBQ3553071.1 HlyC/CorC family transporter [Clostridia bacterium]
MDIPSYIMVLVVLVLLSAYFSATETAFSSLNKTRLKTMVEKGNKKAALALKLSEEYDRLISTILIGNNIVNIAAASIATVMFTQLNPLYGAAISTVVLTVIILIFGEISPKSIAKDCPERFAMFSAPLIRALIWVLTPINFLFTLWKKLLSKIFRLEGSAKMSQEELLMLVEEVQLEGSLDSDEGDLIRNAIEFTEQEAEDILTHRVDVEAVPLDAEKTEIAQMFRDTQYSRLLVYEENIDNIVGIIHLKDFFTETGITEKDIASIMTKPLFIQKSEKINDLLKILQKNKSHIAVVIDEYGGTLGIVTMEDILEELVGEIWDEHDEVIEEFIALGENNFRVDGSYNFDDFCDFFDVECETDSISVGGWAMEQLGKIPENGDSFTYENLTVTVTETDSHRVTQVEVVRAEVSEEDEEEES